MINLGLLALSCILTMIVFYDAHKVGMLHSNLWVLGTFLLPPFVFPLYVIRRSQVRHQGILSARQKREAQLREASRKRRETAEEAKRKWEAERFRAKMENPLRTAAEEKKKYNEQHEMRLILDERMKQQQKLRERRMKLRE